MHNEELDNKEKQEAQTEAQNSGSHVEEPQENKENTGSPEDLLKKERDEWKDKYLRLYAEFDNYKKRTQREKAEWFREAKADVITELLSVLDDFDRAKQANEKNTDVAGLKEGFDLIHHKMIRVLESKGLKPMNSMHQDFNVDLHEAITNIPAPEDKLKGKVVDVIEKGYTLNDHIIRYAKVVVGQ